MARIQGRLMSMAEAHPRFKLGWFRKQRHSLRHSPLSAMGKGAMWRGYPS